MIQELCADANRRGCLGRQATDCEVEHPLALESRIDGRNLEVQLWRCHVNDGVSVNFVDACAFAQFVSYELGIPVCVVRRVCM